MSIEENKGNAAQEQASKPGSHEIAIILNGTSAKVQNGRYSYEQLFALAFPGEAIPADYDQPISYSRPHQHIDGLLRPGQSIELHDGEVINVVPTHKS